MVVTGVVVLLGLTYIEDPYANFHDLFEGSTTSLNALATALVRFMLLPSAWSRNPFITGQS